MFNLQPGQGLGFTGSKQIAFGLGGKGIIAGATETLYFTGSTIRALYFAGVTTREISFAGKTIREIYFKGATDREISFTGRRYTNTLYFKGGKQ